MTIAEQENITKERTEDGQLIFEPGYFGFLRSQNFSIKTVEELDTVQSESEPDKKYYVAKIVTYDRPDDDPKLDYVADEAVVYVCTCWPWRKSSADVSKGEKPSECSGCKHTRSKWKAQRAASDANQGTLL